MTALVLGGLIETNLLLSVQLHQLGRAVFWERPITLLLVAMTIGSLYWVRPRLQSGTNA